MGDKVRESQTRERAAGILLAPFHPNINILSEHRKACQ